MIVCNADDVKARIYKVVSHTARRAEVRIAGKAARSEGRFLIDIRNVGRRYNFGNTFVYRGKIIAIGCFCVPENA